MTAATQTVRVELGPRSYSIEIGTGNLASIGEVVTRMRRASNGVIITDSNVEDPYAVRVAQSLVAAGACVDVLVVPPGEQTKSVEAAEDLWQKMSDLAIDRKAVVIAVGGGVVGDLAGFVAATYARGLALLQIPTTLLAQVDSSVGGKVGVNLPSAKNIVGAFWQPLAVLIDTSVLGTLPDREYRAGLAEVVKYGVIMDASLFEYLEANIEQLKARDAAVLEHVIARCCRLKADVVEQDEREETGQRAVLNYGHTYAHAFETVTGYERLLHGEAVAVGMLCASRLAERLKRIDHRTTERQEQLLAALDLPVTLEGIDEEDVLAAMGRDKKVERGRLKFVLPTKLGHVELVEGVNAADVRAALRPG